MRLGKLYILMQDNTIIYASLCLGKGSVHFSCQDSSNTVESFIIHMTTFRGFAKKKDTHSFISLCTIEHNVCSFCVLTVRCVV